MEVDMKKVSLFSQVAVISSGIFLFLAVLLGVSHAADIAAKYRFQTLSVPDARHTISYGINDLGDVVGVSIDCDFCQPQAFLFSDNQYYDLAVAGASHLTPFGINKAGLIACTLSVGGRQQACLMDDTQTIVLDQAIRADSVNNHGAAVGYLSTSTFNQLAYKWKDGVYKTLAMPTGILGSAATGIAGNGDIVGYWFTDVDGVNVKIQGFVRKKGVLNPIDIIPLGVNAHGVIVGLAGAGNDGAVLQDGVVTLIKVPGADYTQVHGINAKGHIVGYYIKAGQNYGFIGKPVKR